MTIWIMQGRICSFRRELTMAHQPVFIKFPKTLNGDVLQPNSIVSPGPEFKVGEIDLSGDEVYDPILDPQIEVLAKSIESLAVLAAVGFGEEKEKPKLEAQKAQGYRLERTQWYEESGTFIVNHGDKETHEFTITVGSDKKTEHSTSDTLGIEFGTSNTDVKSNDMSLKLKLGDLTLGGNEKSSDSKTTSKNISDALKIDDSSSSIYSTSQTTKISKELVGGETGAR